ncbi:ABC transporter permease [Mycoplasmopsis alligatoris]|nr:ABC transporter permease [Mycoplasmopsis alligatoris]
MSLYYLTKRNFLNFFKDTKKIFFTILTPLILLLFFGFFLNKFSDESFDKLFKGLETTPNITNVKLQEIHRHAFVISFLFIGLLSITAISNAVSLSSIMVQDKQNELLNDFYISPIKNYLIKLSYLLFNIVFNFILSLMIIILVTIYLAIRGLIFTNLVYSILLIVPLTLVNCIVHSIIFVFIFSFIKNLGVFNALASILGTFVGIFVGAYFPLSSFPTWLQSIFSLIPATQMAAIFRNLLYTSLLSNYYGADIIEKLPEWFTNFINTKGLIITYKVEWFYSLTYVVGFGLVFLLMIIFIKTNHAKK